MCTWKLSVENNCQYNNNNNNKPELNYEMKYLLSFGSLSKSNFNCHDTWLKWAWTMFKICEIDRIEFWYVSLLPKRPQKSLAWISYRLICDNLSISAWTCSIFSEVSATNFLNWKICRAFRHVKAKMNIYVFALFAVLVPGQSDGHCIKQHFLFVIIRQLVQCRVSN